MSYLDPVDVCASLSATDPMWVCAGCQGGITGDYTSWLKSNCPLAYQRVYSRANGYTQAQTYANNLLATAIPTTDSGFREVLHQFCNNPGINPGVCQNYLQYKMCPGLSYNDMTSEESDWCGCVTLPSLADQELYGPNVACYPLCHLTDTIQLVDENLLPIQCNNQVCVIDDVSINVVDSKVGTVSINSICPGCTGNCNCIINDVNVTGVDLNINQYCGPNTNCYVTRNGVVTQIPCGPGVRFNRLWLILLIVIIMIISVVIVLVVVYQAFKRR